MSNTPRALQFEHADRIEREVSYLARRRYSVWLRNTSSTAVHVRWLKIALQAEDIAVRDDPMLITVADGLDLRIAPGERGCVETMLVPPLISQPSTAYLSVSAEYDLLGDTGVGPRRVESQRNFDSLILHDAPAHPDAEVFVSFVDPEDGPLADLAAVYLRRAGAQPYLAKRDMRTGCDYWTDKIYPAIRRAAGVLVIWTAWTLRRSDSVLREVEWAQAVGTPVGLFRAQDAPLPAVYPPSVREYTSFDPEAPRCVFAQAIAAGAETWRSTGRFFR